jgi:predicted nucleic acid-binding Zn ribbon protein
MQRRLIESWDEVAGEIIAKYTTEKYIRNQDLCVHIENPALRSEISMMKTELIRKLNNAAGGQVIREIRLV